MVCSHQFVILLILNNTIMQFYGFIIISAYLFLLGAIMGNTFGSYLSSTILDFQPDVNWEGL